MYALEMRMTRLIRYAIAVAAALVSATYTASAQMGDPPEMDHGAPPHGPMHGPMHGGLAPNPAAMLLDHQTELQLSGDQVTKLIALYESTRTEERALHDRMMALLPERPADGSERHMTPPSAPSPGVRDSLVAIHEKWREAHWRATAAANAVLTPVQRQIAATLAARMHEVAMHHHHLGWHGWRHGEPWAHGWRGPNGSDGHRSDSGRVDGHGRDGT
jgi:hypothetical protein